VSRFVAGNQAVSCLRLLGCESLKPCETHNFNLYLQKNFYVMALLREGQTSSWMGNIC